MAYPSNDDPAQKEIDSTISKLADQYASCDRRSAEINDERATIRANVDKLGIDPKGFVHAVAQVKQMSNGERRDYQASVSRVLSVIGDRQGELYPEYAERIRKREERAAEAAAKAGRTQEELDAETNANPRSDPAAGGAGAPPGEQADGEAALAAAAPVTAAKQSQSEKAAKKRAAAGLN
jgi:hypothetical protein